ncbi:MAG TPA: hypothetical protein EYG73_13920 [Arcobacter sp.]|nr:hypothetical protein [Arcobacter sp.]
MIHKLLKADIALVILTLIGVTYLYLSNDISLTFAVILLSIYILAKIIGYKILKYNNFDIFITHLTNESKLSVISGFEIFKTLLVALLFLGFIFIDPKIWIIESILVIGMRIWGYSYILSLKDR